MHSAWFKGLTKEEKTKRQQFLSANVEVFELLSEVLKENFEENVPDYSNPSWAYAQADVNGANRMLRRVLKLIETKEN